MIQGRFEALQAMPDDARQCFENGGLSEGFDYETIAWWDRATSSLRTERSHALHLVGRQAERYSLRFEKERTGKDPIWQGFETAVAGFDVLSVVEAGSPRPLKIEVKGSGMRKNEASFFVTRNEWRTALTSAEFQFHLWLVHHQPKLFVVPVKGVEPHIPKNRGYGEWTGAELFFRDFDGFEQRVEFS
jgi:hypothetical protein